MRSIPTMKISMRNTRRNRKNIATTWTMKHTLTINSLVSKSISTKTTSITRPLASPILPHKSMSISVKAQTIITQTMIITILIFPLHSTTQTTIKSLLQKKSQKRKKMRIAWYRLVIIPNSIVSPIITQVLSIKIHFSYLKRVQGKHSTISTRFNRLHNLLISILSRTTWIKSSQSLTSSKDRNRCGA